MAEGFRRRTLASYSGHPRASGAKEKKWLLLNNHTSSIPWVVLAFQLWLAASLGEGQLRFETHECQVCWRDSTCEDLGSLGMFVHPENRAPAMGQLPPCVRGRFLSQRLEEGHSDRNLKLRSRHSRLSPLSHCGETLSIKSGTGARKPMSTVTI